MILDDSLGLAAELEAQMQHVVEQYECEWANALNDPEKLKRFRTFVTTGAPTPMCTSSASAASAGLLQRCT